LFAVDLVFKALADPTRRALLDRLHHQNGQTLGALCRELHMSRQAVSKHLLLLIRARLVVPLWRGREKLHFLNPAPIKQISDRWLNKYPDACLPALSDLEIALEQLGPSR
jgi:DNA-binding transcriptional ArsR family regulator